MNGSIGGGRWATSPANYLLLKPFRQFAVEPPSGTRVGQMMMTMLEMGERVEKWGSCQTGLLDMLPGFELPGNKDTASSFYSWPWTCFVLFYSSV